MDLLPDDIICLILLQSTEDNLGKINRRTHRVAQSHHYWRQRFIRDFGDDPGSDYQRHYRDSGNLVRVSRSGKPIIYKLGVKLKQAVYYRDGCGCFYLAIDIHNQLLYIRIDKFNNLLERQVVMQNVVRVCSGSTFIDRAGRVNLFGLNSYGQHYIFKIHPNDNLITDFIGTWNAMYYLDTNDNLYCRNTMILRDVVKITPHYDDGKICVMDKYNRIYRVLQESITYIGQGTLTDDGYFMGSCYFLFGVCNYRQIDLSGNMDQICATDEGYYVKPKSQSYVKISADGYLQSPNGNVLLKIGSHYYDRRGCIFSAITKSY